MEDIRLVVLDLGGTTIMDAGQVPEAFSKALQAHGIVLAPDKIDEVRGASKREVINRLVSEQLANGKVDILNLSQRIYDDFVMQLRLTYTSRRINPVPGAVETMKWLHQNGIKLALNTGFDRTITQSILETIGWDQNVYDAIVCGDDVSKGRPAPYMIYHAMEKADVIKIHQVANVGDTSFDLQAGRNAGVCWNIGVLSGAHNRDRLEKEHHTHILHSIAELHRLFEKELRQNGCAYNQ